MKGCQFASDHDKFFSQERNATETFLLYEKKNEGLNHWTEVCGFTSLWNGCEAMGKPLSSIIRPSDLMFDYVNTPANFSKFPDWKGCVAGQLPGNRVQGWFPQVIKDCFNIDTLLHEGLSFVDVCNIVETGNAVQLGRNVGHFIVAVDFDDQNNELIYWDSFHLLISDDDTQLIDDGTNGFRRTMTADWFAKNIRSTFVEVLP